MHAFRETGAAHRVRKQSIVADAMETAGKHMQQEATHELAALQRHGLVAGKRLLAVVLPAERHAAFIEREQALAGDCYTVCVAKEIRKYRFGSRKGTLGVDHPFAGMQWRKPPGKDSRVGESGILTEELQPATPVCLRERFEEAPAEQAREHAHRQKEARSAGNPALTIR
ncbi:hypothetical protein CR51_41950 [Caballeronia megalochromosomata]|nr:hypothetical protein CR51_41950 [Caballeronia megalochromosomata]